MNQKIEPAGAGELTEYLQLQALALAVKALIATHPQPDRLACAMGDLFAQFQTAPLFLALSEPQRLWMREMLSGLLSSLPKPNP